MRVSNGSSFAEARWTQCRVDALAAQVDIKCQVGPPSWLNESLASVANDAFVATAAARDEAGGAALQSVARLAALGARRGGSIGRVAAHVASHTNGACSVGLRPSWLALRTASHLITKLASEKHTSMQALTPGRFEYLPATQPAQVPPDGVVPAEQLKHWLFGSATWPCGQVTHWVCSALAARPTARHKSAQLQKTAWSRT